MTIRTRLAVQFLLLASLILGGAFVVVYVLSADYREDEFMGRLKDRGTNTAKLLIQVDEVDEKLLAKIEGDNPVRLPEEGIAIYNVSGREIFHLGAPHDDNLGPALLERAHVEGEVREQVGDREQVAFTFTNRQDRFVVVASARDIYGKSKLRNEGRVMVVTFLLGLGLIFLVGRFFAQRALSPVQRLINEMRTTSAANLSRRVQADNEQDELAQLARSFNDLLDRLDVTFRSQRNFIANASHELRTPLTAISGQLEVLLLKERTSEAYAAALRSVLEDMHSLNRLSDRLLQMAQAGNTAPTTTFAPVRLDEVLWQARSEVQRIDARYHVEVDLEVEEEEDVLVNGNEALLRSLVTNLMENACKYSADHRARVALHADGRELRVQVADQGIGIPEEHRERIFEPFHRVDNTAMVKGHGVGLSLVARIAELHKGRISLESTVGAGSIFTAHLPKAA